MKRAHPLKLAALGLTAGLLAACSEETAPTYTLEEVVPGSAFHGIHGLTFLSDGTLLAGSVLGSAIYEIDMASGETGIYIGPPTGMADDLEEGPDGSLGWTAFLEGKYYLRTPEGKTLTLAEGLPGMNSTAWSPDGRLFATQVFLGDALYELDPTGANPPRKIMEGMGGLNGFDFGPDGHLYGPLWFKGEVVRVNVDAGTLETVATGFEVPAAVNFDSENNLWVVDTARGHVYRVDVASGEKTLVSQVQPAIDNLAISADDRLVISNMADNAIIAINTETGEATPIVTGALSVAADLAVTENADGSESIYIGDLFALRKLDVASGTVSELGRVFGARIDYPISVGVHNGQLAVAGWSAGAVQLFDRQDQPLDIHHGFSAPTDALPLANGDVLVADYVNGTLLRVNGENWEERTPVASGLVGPTNLLMEDETHVLVSEQLGGTISRVNIETGEKSVLVDELEGPEGFDVRDGTLYVAEVPARQITAITLADGSRTIIGTDLPIGFPAGAGAPPVNVPTGVAVTKDGHVYFASDLEAAIYRLKRD